MNYINISMKDHKAQHLVWDLFFGEDGHSLMLLGEIGKA